MLPLLLSGLAATAFAAVVPESNLLPRDGACSGNTATTRSEWCDYSIDTDYSTVVPDTGVTREYWLELTDVTVAPDGVSRTAMAVNGSIPGPTIYADWGDNVIVHVSNQLTTSNNGTSIHFHGIRQNWTSEYDGVSAITQCPTAPGDSITYKWRATQYGSTWYHSHFALQAFEGVFGGIIINGPATANYDEDLGILTLNDWSHQTCDELYIQAETTGPPELDTGLINGTNVYGEDGDSSQTGERFTLTVEEGTSYRLRIVNAAIDSHFHFSIDNHTLTVISADLVPIVPYTTTVLSMGMGQRYDVIVTADQASVADSFWMRAVPLSACSENANPTNIKGVIYYGDSTSTPSTSAWEADDDSCSDETGFAPYLAKNVGSPTWDDLSDAATSKVNGLFKWYLNSTTMVVDWEDPTLLQVANGNTTFDSSDAVFTLDTANEWIYFVIETTMGVPHPIHLHGHDFYVIGQGTGSFDDSITLNTTNPVRRDTAMLPSKGYLAIAFETDNPGAWLMHCHIGWHTSEGFAVQFLERVSELTFDESYVSDNCAAWSEFQAANSIEQEDSGI